MRFTPFILTVMLLMAPQLLVAAPAEFDLLIKDHKFSPTTLAVPAGVKIKINVTNADSTPEEFESYKLNREKIIPGNSTAFVFIGPLEAGEYEFFGEFNQATAQGKIIAK